MPDDDKAFSFKSLTPKNGREIALLLAGFLVALGVSKIPWITIEPEELSECKVARVGLETKVELLEAKVATLPALQECELDRAGLTATMAAQNREIEALASRVARCWTRYRESVGAPPQDLDQP